MVSEFAVRNLLINCVHNLASVEMRIEQLFERASYVCSQTNPDADLRIYRYLNAAGAYSVLAKQSYADGDTRRGAGLSRQCFRASRSGCPLIPPEFLQIKDLAMFHHPLIAALAALFIAANVGALAIGLYRYLRRTAEDLAQARLKRSLQQEEKALRRSLSPAEQLRRANLPFAHRESMLAQDLHILELSDLAQEPEMETILTAARAHFDRAAAARAHGFNIVATTQHDLCFVARGQAIVASYPLFLARKARLAASNVEALATQAA